MAICGTISLQSVDKRTNQGPAFHGFRTSRNGHGKASFRHSVYPKGPRRKRSEDVREVHFQWAWRAPSSGNWHELCLREATPVKFDRTQGCSED